MSMSKQGWRVVRLGAVSAVAALVLAGCGGGGGDSTADSGSPTPAASVGILTDDPIAGVLYTTRNGATVTRDGAEFRTGADGSFEFTEGETVTFKIGGADITVPATDRVTPVTIAAALFPDDAAKRDNAVTNLSVLFQSLDSDGDANDGKITVLSDVSVSGLGTQASELLAALEKAPQTFATDLQSANAGNDKFNGTAEGPTVADPETALIRFYRNELMGAWQAAKFVQSDGEEAATGVDTFGGVLAFDKGCQTDCELPNDGGTKVAFLHHASYDLTGAEPEADAAVGVLVYVPATDSNPAEFRIQALSRSFNAESGTSSTSDADAAEGGDETALFASTLKIEGNQIVITYPGTNGVSGKPKSHWSRLPNQRDSLLGAWVEILESNPGLTNIADADAKAQLSFAPDASGIFYYFLSPTRALISVTDIGGDDEFNDERNGTMILDYTFNASTRVLSVSRVVLDAVTINANDPAVSVGDTLTFAALTSNQTRVLVTDPSELEDNEFLFRRVLSLSESTGAFAQPVQAEPRP